MVVSIVIFYFYSFLTAIYSYDIESSIKYVIGGALLILIVGVATMYYYIYKPHLMTTLTIFSKVYVLITLVSYFLGLMFMDLGHEHATYYGVFIEKSLPRLKGITIDPNFASLTLVFCFFIFFGQKYTRKNVFLLAVTLFLIFATLSRSGVISLIISFLIISLILDFKKNLIKIIFLIVFLSAFVYFSIDFAFFDYEVFIEKRISGIENGAGRFDMWINAYELFLINPIFGSGAFTFRDLNEFYYNSSRFAHNTYIEVLVEMGIVGFLLYILMILNLMLFSYSNKQIRVFIFPSFISFLIMLFTLSLYINSVSIFFYIIAIYAHGCELNLIKEEVL
ncbi:TPA: O-antigen ligase family protein [Vibrio cholerae]|uniref:O-antigen ligase family protein n=1 Tax=Vibrio cholerae TaxID=666 RepID=UPI0012FF0CCE|nr:O-antigen ligase family protein [Vibrio cholerae]HCJ7293381.1 O-antigen ligase family protein [Vibrio cholerae]HCJ7324232.1 O-antigen ligase family protein [Vibrio cholerae]HCK0019486.1 O-antigen ligase family protein [Vibrio cholerae]